MADDISSTNAVLYGLQFDKVVSALIGVHAFTVLAPQILVLQHMLEAVLPKGILHSPWINLHTTTNTGYATNISSDVYLSLTTFSSQLIVPVCHILVTLRIGQSACHAKAKLN